MKNSKNNGDKKNRRSFVSKRSYNKNKNIDQNINIRKIVESTNKEKTKNKLLESEVITNSEESKDQEKINKRTKKFLCDLIDNEEDKNFVSEFDIRENFELNNDKLYEFEDRSTDESNFENQLDASEENEQSHNIINDEEKTFDNDYEIICDDEKIISELENLEDYEEIENFYKQNKNIKVSDARKIINIVLKHYNKTKSVEILKLIHLINLEYNLNLKIHAEVLNLINIESLNALFFDFLKLYILDLNSMTDIKELLDKLLDLAFNVSSQKCLDLLQIVWLICRIYKVKIEGERLKYFLNGIIPIKKAAYKIINASNDITKFDKYSLVATIDWKPITEYLKY